MIIWIHNRTLKLPRADPSFKKHIKLAVRPPLGLRQSKESPHNHNPTRAGPKERRLSTPVPIRIAELIVRQHVDHDVRGVVQRAREHDGLGFEARRRHLRDDGVRHGADGEVVDEDKEDEDAADGPVGGGRAGERARAYDDQGREEHAAAAEVDRSASEVLH